MERDENKIHEIQAIKLLLREDCISNCKPNISCELCEAEKVYNAGYRKIVWHKVADGDLPSNTDDIVVVGRFGSTFCAFYDNEVKRFFVHTCTIGYSLKDIIAWTELPKYEE